MDFVSDKNQMVKNQMILQKAYLFSPDRSNYRVVRIAGKWKPRNPRPFAPERNAVSSLIPHQFIRIVTDVRHFGFMENYAEFLEFV